MKFFIFLSSFSFFSLAYWAEQKLTKFNLIIVRLFIGPIFVAEQMHQAYMLFDRIDKLLANHIIETGAIPKSCTYDKRQIRIKIYEPLFFGRQNWKPIQKGETNVVFYNGDNKG